MAQWPSKGAFLFMDQESIIIFLFIPQTIDVKGNYSFAHFIAIIDTVDEMNWTSTV